MGGRRICNLKLYVISGLTVMVFITIMNFTGIEQFHLAQKAWEEEKLIIAKNTQPKIVPESPEAIFKLGEHGNYEPIPEKRRQKRKVGPGENGRGAMAANNETAYRLYGCDMTVSDGISLERTLYDSRHKECRFWHYPRHLPTASVVVVFFNEGNSTLLRTVHSVINRSPPHLLREVVLVDDGSTMDHLKDPLEKYIQRFNGKVKLYRNKARLGLIGARMSGAKEAIGDVIVVLDSHCECNVNWLPPLLQRIALNRKTLAQPTVDMISYDTFEYRNIHHTRAIMGVFDWGLLYKEMPLPETIKKVRKHPTEPYGTPTHAGGLFAIDRKYFFEIGGYDPNLLVWGAENFQLSFKLWMCGGRVEWVPCSRVGHVYHKFVPYSLELENVQGPKGMTWITHNFLRVAEGWMDNYKEYFYIREPSLRSRTVNVTDELLLRKKMKCKSFDWYMKNVAKGMLDYFPLPVPNKSWGMIHQRHGKKCLSAGGKVGGCPQGIYRYNKAGQISTGEYCMALHESKREFLINKCPDSRAYSWDWNEKTGLIRHPGVDLCIQSPDDDQDSSVTLETCDPENEDQMWDMKKIPQKL